MKDENQERDTAKEKLLSEVFKYGRQLSRGARPLDVACDLTVEPYQVGPDRLGSMDLSPIAVIILLQVMGNMIAQRGI